jgi:hypothetical protein
MSASDPEESFALITDPKSEEFAQFFAIYEASIPEYERKSRAAIEALAARTDYRVVGLRMNGEIVAFFILFLSIAHSLALLEYMATKSSARNGGLGAKLFKKAAELTGALPMLVEVDSEREDTPDRALRVRRKDFYLRHGCRQIRHLNYQMPMVGNAEPPMMDLLLHSTSHKEAPSLDLVRQWLEHIYVDVYGCSRDDERITAMMRSLAINAEGVR